MGAVKDAMIEVQEAGCLWLDDALIGRLRDAGLEPKTQRITVSGRGWPVELEVLPATEGFRMLSLVDGDDYDAIADALCEML